MKNVQEKIGYTFKNVNLLETALTHSSYANECKKENNERLEFLGDSVLSVIISDYIFRRLPNVDEGWLSKYRATLVCEQSLNEISKKISLSKFILLGKVDYPFSCRFHTAVKINCRQNRLKCV